MKFFGGFIVGVLSTLLVLFIIGIGYNYSEKEVQRQVQYVEVKGKKGNVTLYTGMPKDSVQMLVGKPDKVNMHTTRGITFEDWGYKIKNQYVSDLDIDFVDGKLRGVRQN